MEVGQLVVAPSDEMVGMTTMAIYRGPAEPRVQAKLGSLLPPSGVSRQPSFASRSARSSSRRASRS